MKMRIFVRVYSKRLHCLDEQLNVWQYYFRLHFAKYDWECRYDTNLTPQQTDRDDLFYDTPQQARRAGRDIANRIKAAAITVISEPTQHVKLERVD